MKYISDIIESYLQLLLMQERHTDRRRYFHEQAYTTKKYVIPYISKVKVVSKQLKVLEIGCGEGGNLLPFAELGCKVVGVDLNLPQLDRAKLYLEENGQENISLVHKNIYDVDEDFGTFDIIFLRDVIEHIPNQERFMIHVRKFLHKDGVIFFGFPPWQMPFGGHQQAIRNRIFSKIPYTHLLPRSIYKMVMKASGVLPVVIDSRLDIWDTGISIEKMEKCLKAADLEIREKTLFLINPNYEVKFKLNPTKQLPILRSIPYFRNFITTCAYYLVSTKKTL